MVDWNWFFSALPQSAAAIVGLLGAFIITKILSNEAEFKQTRSLAETLLDESQHLRDKLRGRHFDWYNETSIAEELEDLRDELKEDGLSELRSPDYYYSRRSFSPYVPRQDAIKALRDFIEHIRNRAGDRKTATDRVGDLTFQLTEPPRIPSAVLSESLRAERDSIDHLVVDVEQQIRRITTLRGQLTTQPHSTHLISVAILLTLLIFFVAVVYPLGWLPSSGPPSPSLAPTAILSAATSFRGLLLFTLALIFSTAMGLFWWRNRTLRYSESLLSRLQDRMQLSWYSDYLAVLEANRASEEVTSAGGEDDS